MDGGGCGWEVEVRDSGYGWVVVVGDSVCGWMVVVGVFGWQWWVQSMHIDQHPPLPTTNIGGQ